MRITFILLCCLFVGGVLLAGCGNKGDLYKADTQANETYKPEPE